MKLYTLGYSGWEPHQIRDAVEELDAVLLDVRFMPFVRNKKFTRDAFGHLLGERYRWVRDLGNKNYKGGPIELVDLDRGVEVVEEIVMLGQSAVLMCVCKTIRFCHRRPAASAIAARLSLDIEHLNEIDPKERNGDWVHIAEVLKTTHVPPGCAEVLKEAMTRMRKKGDVGQANAWQAIEYIAAEYLAGA